MLCMFRTVLVHNQEQPFISCTSHLVYAGTIRVAVVNLDGLYTYCKMMHGECDVKLRIHLSVRLDLYLLH